MKNSQNSLAYKELTSEESALVNGGGVKEAAYEVSFLGHMIRGSAGLLGFAYWAGYVVVLSNAK